MPTETSFLPQTSRAPAFLINPGSGTYEDHIPYTPDSYEEHYHHSPTSSFGGDFGNYGYGLDPSPRYHYGQTHNQQDNWTGHNTLPHNQTNQSPLYVPVTTSPLPYDETQEKTETYQKPTKLKSKPPEEIARYVTEIEEALTDLQGTDTSLYISFNISLTRIQTAQNQRIRTNPRHPKINSSRSSPPSPISTSPKSTRSTIAEGNAESAPLGRTSLQKTSTNWLRPTAATVNSGWD